MMPDQFSEGVAVKISTAIAVPLLAFTLLVSGCSSVRTRLVASPDDSNIYVDNEFVGKGSAEIDVGQEYNWPKSYDIKIHRKDFKTVNTTIKNEPDYTTSGLNFGILMALSIFNLSMWANNPKSNFSNLVMAGAGVIVSPVVFFNTNKFKKTYSFELEENRDLKK
jgi:hypothetical protein